jgi:predicted TIM-barrel fold metal-dependent hydrolase
MTLPFDLVSADSHVVEPPDLWTKRIDKQYRDVGMRVESRADSDYLVCPERPDMPEMPLGRMATKRKYDNPDAVDFGVEAGRFSGVPEPAYDPVERVKEMDREGIEAEMMYTSMGLTMYAFKDRGFRDASFRAFNDWMAEFCSYAPKRLFGIAMIPTDEIDRDVAELERCAKMGLRGAMLSISQESGETYSSGRFDRLLAAFNDMEIPISLHVAASETSFTVTRNKFVDFTAGWTPTMYTVLEMIFSGVFDRYPKLKVISVENDASWPLPILERADDRWKHDQKWAGVNGAAGITSGRLPSEIFRQHVAASFMRDRTAILNRDIIGKKNIMWGSDYPHFDGAWPNQKAILERQLEGVPLEDQIRIGRTNCIDFYKLPIETPAIQREAALA